MSETTTISGMRPVAGTNPTAGHRDYAITIERDGHEDIEAVTVLWRKRQRPKAPDC